MRGSGRPSTRVFLIPVHSAGLYRPGGCGVSPYIFTSCA